MDSQRSALVRVALFAGAGLLGLALLTSCSGAGGDSEVSRRKGDKQEASGGARTATGGSAKFVQDMWIYDRVATLDEQDVETDLAPLIKEYFAGSESDDEDATELADGFTFHRRDELKPFIIDAEKSPRSDVDVVAGLVVGEDGAPQLAVLATPVADAEEPIGTSDRIQLDLSVFAESLSPGAPLILDYAMLQAYGDFSADGDPDEKALGGLGLFKHRLSKGRVQWLAADDGDDVPMLFSGEIGALARTSTDARAGDESGASGGDDGSDEESPASTESGERSMGAEPSLELMAYAQDSVGYSADLPAKSQPMMDGFRRGIEKCGSRGGFGLACTRKYMKSMYGGTKDSMRLIDCNLSPSARNCEPEPEDDDETTTTTTSTTSTTTTSTTSTTTPPTTKPPRRPKDPKDPKPFCLFRCGKTVGDPHIQTFDGYSYGMHGIGEFVAAKHDELEVQIRTATEGARTISWTEAVAIGSGKSRVEIDSDGVKVNGKSQNPSELAEGIELPDGRLEQTGATTQFRTKAGHLVTVTKVSARWVDLWIDLAEDSKGWVGLLGDTDGDQSNDLVTSDGKVMTQPLDLDDMYKVFAEGWRITNETSLFTYRKGEDTDTFTDRSFPKGPVSMETLDPADKRWAERMCRAAGIEDRTAFEECVIDLAITGDVAMIRSAFRSDTVSGIRDGRFGPDGAAADGSSGSSGSGDGTVVVRDKDPWQVTARDIREVADEHSRFRCPAGGNPYTVWGTDVYTDDSSVCTAAVHIGLFGLDDGGEVLIDHLPGERSYRGSTRNGVSTRDWGSWSGTFVFIGARGTPITGS